MRLQLFMGLVGLLAVVLIPRGAGGTADAQPSKVAANSSVPPPAIKRPAPLQPSAPTAASPPEQHTLQHHASPASPTTTPVTFFIYRPNAPAAAALAATSGGTPAPVVFLLNGASVEAEQYAALSQRLAGRGYTVVLSNYHRALAFTGWNWTAPAKCPIKDGKPVSPSMALLRTFADWAVASKESKLQDLQSRGVVLLSHSMGGAIAISALADQCSTPTANTTANTPAAPLTAYYCEGYQPAPHPNACALRNGALRNKLAPSDAAISPDSLLRGVVAWEGYVPGNITLSPGTFLALMGSPQNNATRSFFPAAAVQPGSCSCVTYAQLPGTSHYAITTAGVTTPCGAPGRSDPADYRIQSEAAQAGTLTNMARLIDDQVRAFALGDKAALGRLAAEAAAKPASAGAGQQGGPPLLLMNPACYKV